MKKIFLFCTIFSNCFLINSSMIHQALEYVPDSASKAAARKSLGAQSRNSFDQMPEGARLSNTDLARIAQDYWNYLKTGEGRFFDLITRETKRSGFEPLGLLAQDVQEIEAFIEKYFMSIPSQSNTLDTIIDFVHPNLPDLLARKYENKTSEWFDSVVLDPKYRFLGPESIRACIAEYAFQEWNKKIIGHKKYWHVKKREDLPEKLLEKIENQISRVLENAEFGFRYISDIENNQIDDSRIEYIIIQAQDLNNPQYLQTLNAILHRKTGNPNLKVVVVFDDQFTEIPDNFKIPNFIKHVVILGRNITSIGHLCMSDLINLLTVDMSGLSKVKTIGKSFLSGCHGLIMVDVSRLSKMKTIGDFFLSGCKLLRKIDLSKFLDVETIGDFFLSGCGALRTLDLSGFSNVKTIGEFFLYDCKNLSTINLNSWYKVRSIGRDFLNGCASLQHLNLAGLSNLNTIESYFLYRCSGLSYIDLSPLSKVTSIQGGFLNACSNLVSVDLTVFLNLSEISYYILQYCDKLQTIKLTEKMYYYLKKYNEDLFSSFSKSEENDTVILERKSSSADSAINSASAASAASAAAANTF